jgi:hypothetical protein
VTSGFYGSLTQAFRNAEPAWTGVVAVMVLLPLVSHSLEFAIHFVRGTPHLRASIISSAVFTMFSTAFNWFAMRRGALVVGQGESSLAGDLARVPALLWEFFKAAAQIPAVLFQNINRAICLFACNEAVKPSADDEIDAGSASV